MLMPAGTDHLLSIRDITDSTKGLPAQERADHIECLFTAQAFDRAKPDEQCIFKRDVLKPAFQGGVTFDPFDSGAFKRLADRLDFRTWQCIQKRPLSLVEKLKRIVPSICPRPPASSS